MKRLFILYLCIVFSTPLSANDENKRKISKSEYINAYKQDAIRNMIEFKIPASITMAQAILESGTGNSELAVKANNHFGIKCHKEWTGKKVYHDDDKKNECFRKYRTVYESFQDHSKFLTTRDRYSFLFDYEITDYKKWAHGLKKAGYATNPKYPQLLIKIIEENNLQALDKEALTGKGTKVSAVKRSKDKNESSKSTARSDNSASNNIDLLPAINNVKYTIAEENDTYLSIAKKYEMMLWQIHKYNDVGKGSEPEAGQVVFLKPKRSRSATETHTVTEGETLYSISQKYAVKLKKLYKYNSLGPGDKLSAGQKIRLKR